LGRLARGIVVCAAFPLAFALQAPAARADEADADFDPSPIVSLLELVIDADPGTAGECLRTLADKIQSGEVSKDRAQALRESLAPIVAKRLAADDPLALDAALLASTWKDRAALQIARAAFDDESAPVEKRIRALAALIFAEDRQAVGAAGDLLAKSNDRELRGAILEALGEDSSPETADAVLAAYAKLDPDLQPKAVEMLSQRPAWSKRLVAAIAAKEIPAAAVNVNQAARLLDSRDEELRTAAAAIWGAVRTERNPQREEVIQRMRRLLTEKPANPERGIAAFQKVCGQCHTIHGAGQNVGPDITSNGRASFEQLLSNVFDPSLVIGAAYQAKTAYLSDGRVLTGLVVEDNDQRLVLKMQGGKTETIPRDEIEEVSLSNLSLMPEGVETQLSEQEIIDLFGYLTLDRPPSDPAARWIPGAPALVE
jgi:putative heme-binding domain-containing protein